MMKETRPNMPLNLIEKFIFPNLNKLSSSFGFEEARRGLIEPVLSFVTVRICFEAKDAPINLWYKF